MVNTRLFFGLTSFIGQGLSYGKVYASHLAAIPYLIFNYRSIIQIRGYQLRFSIFILWSLCTLVWSHDLSSIKYFAFILFGYFQYSYWNTSEKGSEQTLNLFFWLAMVDLCIGLCEGLNLFRYPLSSMNPDVVFWKKLPEFYFPELNQVQINYLKTTPTGLRWGANNFMISALIYMVFVQRFMNRTFFWLLYIVLAVLAVQTSSRLIFWAYIPIFTGAFLLARQWKGAACAFLVPIFLCGLFLLEGGILAHKANECLDFPLRLFSQVTHFDEKVVTEYKKPIELKSEANQLSSEASRYEYMTDAMTIWKQSPIIGAGLGKSSIEPATGKAQSPHFYFLEILADTGIIGLIIFLCVGLVPLFRIVNFSPADLSFHFSITAVVILGSIALSSLVYFPLFYLALGYSHAEIQRMVELGSTSPE